MSNSNRLLACVHNVTNLLSSAASPDSALKLMLEAAISAVDASGGSILLHDANQKQLWFNLVLGGESQGSGLSAGFGLYGVSINDDEGIAGQVFQSQKPHIENKTSENPQHARRIDEEFDFETKTLITVPLIYPGGEAFGVMQLVNKKSGEFTDEDLMVLDIVANISAMNVHNANLVNESRRSKALDYLGRVIHDVANKVTNLEEPAGALQAAQQEAMKKLDAPAEIKTDLNDKLCLISAGIHDLLRYTDFMSGAVEGKPLAGNRVLDDMVSVTDRQLALLEGIVSARGVKLEKVFQTDGKLVFPFDSFLLERAIFNLVNNALKATLSGGTITVSVYSEGPSAVLAVKDTGIGMQPNVLAKVLNWNPSGTVSNGTGLSTSIVREVAEMHGGTFEGDSIPGQGTIFRLRLPIHFEEVE